MSDMAERELAQELARERADWMEKAGEYLERLHEAELERDAANRRYRELAAAREDTERPEGHKLDRLSYLSGYYQGAALLTAAIKPSNTDALEDFAKRAWKATGADIEQEQER